MTEQTDRRARYAAAMDAVSGGICPTDLIDAVMAVADAELQQERERLFVPLHRAEADNARLRAATPAGPAPATDQTALRDRIAEAIGRTDLLWWSKERRYEAANAAMAVLPAPDQRAAVERAFVERLAAELKGCCSECDACIEIAQHMAGEAQDGVTKRPPMDPVHILGIGADDAVARPGQPETDEDAVVVHACPEPGDNGISRCCGRPPCEFVGERLTRDPEKVTCQGG